MNKKIFSIYGAFLIAMGLVGFLLTHAKSALISGLASGAIMFALSFFVDKTVVDYISKALTTIFLGVFTWRFSLALGAVLGGNAEKLVPAVILGAMALMSLATLIAAIISSRKCSISAIS